MLNDFSHLLIFGWDVRVACIFFIFRNQGQSIGSVKIQCFVKGHNANDSLVVLELKPPSHRCPGPHNKSLITIVCPAITHLSCSLFSFSLVINYSPSSGPCTVAVDCKMLKLKIN